ncbi:type II toxin-antitoxin system antitoxin SocA domain-containing protein [Xanthomonas maliensis]|uniref:Panacea domain-containing protein n=1 Tax=Xanthomonas maliensis TaxID=1321368 RepID=UPI0014785DBE
MQLLKLVYIAHGWHLGYTGQALIAEEVQAWRHGPVIKELYDRIRHYGSSAVRGLVAPNAFGGMPQAVGGEVVPLLDGVWKSYSRFSGIELSEMTHRPDTPWSVAWHLLGGKGTKFAPISNDLIRDHYQGKIREAQQRG